MGQYAVISPSGSVENIIVWDGETQIALPSGCSVEEVTDAHIAQWNANSSRASIQPVTRAQGRLALYRAGYLEQLEAIIAQADMGVRIWYEDAQVWERTDPTLIAMGAALGLTSSQIDALFLGEV